MKKSGFHVRDICLTAIFAALTAVFAQISVPLPFSPVPVSFAMVGLYISAILLPPKCAVMSQICYLLLGAAGLPIFSGFKGGIATLLGPTGGYLSVYPIMAAIVSVALNSNRAVQAETTQRGVFVKGAVSVCAAHLTLYLGGTIWLCFTTGSTFVAGLALAVFPYIPLDIVKIIFCVTAIIPLRKRLIQAGMLNIPAKKAKKDEAK